MLWFTEGRKRLSSKWLFITLCMLAGLVLTFTMGAWAALVATFVLFVVLSGRAKKGKVVLVGVLVLALMAGVVTYGPLRPVFTAKVTGDAIGSFAWDAATRLRTVRGDIRYRLWRIGQRRCYRGHNQCNGAN
jgi:4-hydroxybenzoate polyprenyltransferase